LEDALSELAEFLHERQSLRSKLTAALVYPAILLILGICVVLFLMSFVLPQLLTVLIASGKPLPASTTLLKHASDLLVAHWLGLALTAMMAFASITALLKTKPGRYVWQRVQLRLPLLGPLTRKTIVAQFAQMTAMLLRSGVPFVEVASVVSSATKNTLLASELENVKSSVEAGSDIAPALAHSRIFPPLVVQLIDVGQRTGELTEMLNQLKAGYEAEVRLAISKFTSALEPILIILLAGVIGFIVFATMMPILEATRVMQ
jgi:type II secretory pathway component PulF